MYDTDSELYNDLLGIYFHEYDRLIVAKRKTIGSKHDPTNLFFETYNYDLWFENEESANKEESTDQEESADLSDMIPLEGNEEVKEGKGLKILAPNTLITRLPILLAQIKPGNNLYKLKIEMKQILYLLYYKITKKSIQQFNKFILIMEEKIIVIRDPKTFNFDFY